MLPIYIPVIYNKKTSVNKNQNIKNIALMKVKYFIYDYIKAK